MGNYRTMEDDVAKISTSVFIMNFPESCSAKDLFQSCKQYGHIVDTFIPTKRSKTGKRFGFVRFINVFNEERLVKNLCTVWIDRSRLHANIARYHRTPLNETNVKSNKPGDIKSNSIHVAKKDIGANGVGNSYVHVVKGQMKSEIREGDLSPALVLSDECLQSKDLSKSLFGRVKQFASLANLRTVVSNEGFVDIKIQYMGELWVLLEFGSKDSIKLFQDNVSIGSWFSQPKQANMEFNTEGRIAWVEVEGVPFKLWSDNTFNRIATKWGELLDIDDQDEMCLLIRAKEAPGWVSDFTDENDDEKLNDEVSKEGELKIHEARSCGEDSEVEEMLNKKEVIENEKNSRHSLKYPPGFTPKEGTDATGMNVEESRNDHTVKLSDRITEEVNNAFSGNGSNNNSKEDVSCSVCSGRFKKSEVPRTGGSLLSLMDKLVKVSQDMGYKMEGCLAQKAKKDWVKELCVKHKVNFLALQETKMEHMELFSVKMCWGNLVFDFFHSDSVVWRITGKDLLIIAVYAPHDNKDKQMLWDYLTYDIGKWKGEVVIMGDFNEVRAGLEEVPLDGSTFTWCHKSATNMSKLDRFLIFETLFNSCLNILAITLERYLSDHRPILLRESHFDYGPTSFRFFHYWIDMEGFSKVVEDAWREGPCDEANAMMNMMMKLKFLKTKIREWNKENMLNMKNVKAKHKEELKALEEIIDKGNGNEVVVNKRMEVVNTLQKIDKIHSFKMAQKAKVNWSIEGDENTSFFHGMLNKKRRQQNIRGIIIDEIWIDNPIRVKDEFFQHFSSRFDKPNARRAHIEMRYPKTITCDQQADLERDVSNEEIKRAVWDCGTDKSPGLDGFSFGFYRRFWYLIENDVYDVVRYFFTYEVIPKGCNSSFIALIPKSPGANTVKDFRPISLIGSVYKIIAKILANRLVGVLGDIVNEVQSAFIADRQILDGPFILNEVLQWCKKKKNNL
ncbi:RNA-directed DNA polymerase, eukaryota [Tanacetum coccineum]